MDSSYRDQRIYRLHTARATDLAAASCILSLLCPAPPKPRHCGADTSPRACSPQRGGPVVLPAPWHAAHPQAFQARGAADRPVGFGRFGTCWRPGGRHILVKKGGNPCPACARCYQKRWLGPGHAPHTGCHTGRRWSGWR